MDRRKLVEECLGYLNLSDGRPSAAFRRNLSDFYRTAGPAPWSEFASDGFQMLQHLAGTTAVFREIAPAIRCLRLAYDFVLPRYQEFHQDLLAHCSAVDLFQPFFLARTLEHCLRPDGPPLPAVDPGTTPVAQWPAEHQAAYASRTDWVIKHLNDFVGYRPVAVLEREALRPYPHEYCGAVPVFYRETGVAFGPFERLLAQAIEILAASDPVVLRAGGFDFAQAEELALDPRAYDFLHPVHQRPAYQLGEWDPGQLDARGNYRRYVLRWPLLVGLTLWQKQSRSPEAEFEASATLAGAIFLSGGVCGPSPSARTSDITLASVVSQIARARDEFFNHLLQRQTGARARWVRQDAEATHQPFGSVRQFLNRHMANMRAEQMRRDALSQIYAQMGFAAAATAEAKRISITSTRMQAEICNALTEGRQQIAQGNWPAGRDCFRRAQTLLHRAIGCGAVMDPWNILGFGGYFTLDTTSQSSINDQRIDDLLNIMQDIFDFGSRLLRESAAAGASEVTRDLDGELARLAAWWDRYATTEVSGYARVSGEDTLTSARFVVQVMQQRQQAGTAAGDVRFWNTHAAEFRTPQVYALVLETLLETGDYVAALALLMHWLGHEESVPLESGQASFHTLALRWHRLVTTPNTLKALNMRGWESGEKVLQRFFDLWEANADEQWRLPSRDEMGLAAAPAVPERTSDDDDIAEPQRGGLFSAAYEGFSYEDSADDGQDSSLAEQGGMSDDEDDLRRQADSLKGPLHLIDTAAELWLRTAEHLANQPASEEAQAVVATCLRQAAARAKDLDEFLAMLHQTPLASDPGSEGAIVDYARRVHIRSFMIEEAITTRVHVASAMRALLRLSDDMDLTPAPKPRNPRRRGQAPAPLRDDGTAVANWERHVLAVERALHARDIGSVRDRLPDLGHALASVPILYTPLEAGGTPEQIIQVRYGRDALRDVVEELPRFGLLKGTFDLLSNAIERELLQASFGQQVTEFTQLFASGFQSVMRHLALGFKYWPECAGDTDKQWDLLHDVVGRFDGLWRTHLQGLRLAEAERFSDQRGRNRVDRFISRYGRDLFTPYTMTVPFIQGILQTGTAAHLKRLVKNAGDTTEEWAIPEDSQLVQDLKGRGVKKTNLYKELGETLQHILRSVVESYECFLEYNATTTLSDYGENLVVLMDFIRLNAAYQREEWLLRPWISAHEVMCRLDLPDLAHRVHQEVQRNTSDLADVFETQLLDLERRHSIKLATIGNRIRERFERPLAFDRIVALVEPSVKEARAGRPAAQFDQLHRMLDAWQDEAESGNAFELPPWVEQLESEVDRVIDPVGDPPTPPEPPSFSLADLRRELRGWFPPPSRR